MGSVKKKRNPKAVYKRATGIPGKDGKTVKVKGPSFKIGKVDVPDNEQLAKDRAKLVEIEKTITDRKMPDSAKEKILKSYKDARVKYIDGLKRKLANREKESARLNKRGYYRDLSLSPKEAAAKMKEEKMDIVRSKKDVQKLKEQLLKQEAKSKKDLDRVISSISGKKPSKKKARKKAGKKKAAKKSVKKKSTKKPSKKKSSTKPSKKKVSKKPSKKKSSKRSYKAGKKKTTKRRKNPIEVLANPSKIEIMDNPRKKKASKKKAKKSGKKKSSKKSGKKKSSKKSGKKKSSKKVSSKVEEVKTKKKARKSKGRKKSYKAKSVKAKSTKKSKAAFKKKKHKIKKNPQRGSGMASSKFEMVTKHDVMEAGGLAVGGVAIKLYNHHLKQKFVTLPGIRNIYSMIPAKASPAFDGLIDVLLAAGLGHLASFAAKKAGKGQDQAEAFAKGLIGAAVVNFAMKSTQSVYAVAGKQMAGFVAVPSLDGIIAVPEMNGIIAVSEMNGLGDADFGQYGNDADFGAIIASPEMEGMGEADFGEADFGEYEYEDEGADY